MPELDSQITTPALEPERSAAAPLHTEGLDAMSAADHPNGLMAADSAIPEWNGWLNGAQDQVGGLLDAGGPVILVLGLLSVVALAIVLLKLWQFARLQLDRHGPVESALRHWRRNDAESALAAVAGSRQPVACLVHLALDGLQRPKVDLVTLREELVRVASVQMQQLRGYLRALEIIGTLSPLLGLLGTVLGMIEAFRQLEAAGAQVDPAILSGGIWQALLTTAAGLTVAIPVVLAHTWLERRVERCGHQMENAVTQVFTRGLVPPEIEGGDAAVTRAAEVGYAV